MGQSRTIHTPEEIVAKGEALERERGLGNVTAWDIHKTLGQKGKYARVEDLWGQHLATRVSAPAEVAEELPAELVADLDAQVHAMGTAIRSLLAGEIGRRTAMHVRQMTLVEKQGADELAAARAEHQRQKDALVAEIGRWREEAGRLADREEELLEELERERTLRQAAETAAARAKAAPWPLPVVGERTPIVLPVSVVPPLPEAVPELRVQSIRRGRSRLAVRQAEGPVEGPAPGSTMPAPAADTDQLGMPF